MDFIHFIETHFENEKLPVYVEHNGQFSYTVFLHESNEGAGSEIVKAITRKKPLLEIMLKFRPNNEVIGPEGFYAPLPDRDEIIRRFGIQKYNLKNRAPSGYCLEVFENDKLAANHAIKECIDRLGDVFTDWNLVILQE